MEQQLGVEIQMDSKMGVKFMQELGYICLQAIFILAQGGIPKNTSNSMQF